MRITKVKDEEIEVQKVKRPIGRWPWLLLLLAIIYDISPIDLIPDIPIVGWVDDIGLTLYALLNLWQAYTGRTSPHLRRFVIWMKVVVVIVTLLLIALLFYLGKLLFT